MDTRAWVCVLFYVKMCACMSVCVKFYRLELRLYAPYRFLFGNRYDVNFHENALSIVPSSMP